MKKYLTKRNLSIAALIIIPLVIMITIGVYYSVSDTCIMCSPTPTYTPTQTNVAIVTPTPKPPIPSLPPLSPPSSLEEMFEYCSQACGHMLIGNGICDYSCNTANCSYDGGDCD